MNQGFKLRYDQLRENDPTRTDQEPVADANEFYTSVGYTRNLCLVWPDGRRAFFNYAYLIVGEFEPNTDKSLIKLGFSSHTVSLQGYSLQPLFMALLDHLPRIITTTDPRYVLDEDKLNEVVVEIIVDKNEN